MISNVKTAQNLRNYETPKRKFSEMMSKKNTLTERGKLVRVRRMVSKTSKPWKRLIKLI